MPSSIAQLLESHVVAAGVAGAASAGFRWASSSSASSSCVAWPGAVGVAGTATPDAVYDLASLTKPCCALLTCHLAAKGLLQLSAPISSLLPQLRGTPGGDASFEAHLSHRANMKPHIELFQRAQAGFATNRAVLMRQVAHATLPERPAQSVPEAVYSDLGYILVGQALEALCQAPLDEILAAELTEPLQLELRSARQWMRVGADFRRRTPPTEDVPQRGGVVQGVVHDDNAWALEGTGLSGHAGLFGTLEGVLRFATLLTAGVRGDGVLRDVCRPLVEVRPGGTLRMGVDGVSREGSAAGTLAEKNTFGHLGFTGTSFWCDPDKGLSTVLLTNRTYPRRDDPSGIRRARPAVHDGLRLLAAGSLGTPP